jgi:hypothetical protein
VSLESGSADAGEHPHVKSGRVRRWRTIRAGGCAFAAAALLLGGAAQASNAAAAGAWENYTVPFSGGALTGIYAPSINDAWATGYNNSGYTTATDYAQFNGTAWSAVSGPQIGEPAAIDGSSASDVWVIGSDGTAYYNGSSWATYAPYVPADDVYDTIDYGASLYVAGPDDAWAAFGVQVADDTELTLLEHFNGTSWSLASIPGFSFDNPDSSDSDYVGQITGSGPNDVDVVTFNQDSSSELVNYNGSDWTIEAVPDEQSVEDLEFAVTGPGDAQAGGITGFTGYAAQETGGTWSLASPPVAGDFSDNLTGANGYAWQDLAPDSGLITGQFTPTLWQWSAGTWQQIAVNPYTYILAVADGSGVWSYSSADNTVALYQG